MFLYIIVALAALIVMVVIHEFGHYIVGKLLKFKINEFSIGFGPKIFQHKNKKTGELFSVRWIMLGGYCAFDGEDEIPESETNSVVPKASDPATDIFSDQEENGIAIAQSSSDDRSALRSFNEQSPWKRILVLIAGAGFNFISAIIFSVIFLCAGGMTTPVVQRVYTDPNGVAYNQELHVGDEIIEVNGQKITAMNTYDEIMAGIGADSVMYTVIREGEQIKINVVRKDIVTEKGETYRGFGYESLSVVHGMDFGSALLYSIPYTLKLSWVILGTIGQLFTGRIALTSLSGPVSTVQVMAEVTRQNWMNLFVLLPLISANLAIFNVLPIPALDGSKIVFTAIEWIRKKPISRKVEAYIHTCGFFFLIILCVVVELFHFL